MLQWGIFIGLSVLLIGHTLIRPHRHRFNRLVVFECLLGLIILNAQVWFRNPFSIQQIFSWFALIASLWLAWHGFSLLRRVGAPSEDIENTTRLVTAGAYRYIRHPLYASLLLLGAGILLKGVTLLTAGIFITLLVFLYATARVEEKENLEKFGDHYRQYMTATKMFLPFLV